MQLKKIIACAALLAPFAVQAQSISPTAHADLAQQLVTGLVAGTTNQYNDEGAPTEVLLAGVNGSTVYKNVSVCAPFVTSLIKLGNNLSNDQFKARFNTTTTSPNSATWYSFITSGNRFTRIHHAASIAKGDVIAMSYCSGGSGTGHTMIAMGTPVLRTATKPIIAGTVQYEVQVADSTSSPRGVAGYPDTRVSGDGAGIGTFRIYADEVTGEIKGYTWTMSSGSTYYDTSGCRKIAVGRLF